MGITQGSRNTKLSLMVLSAIAVMAQAGVAQADDTSSATKLDTIQVTGSNIRRTDTETPSEVQVITADDLKKSGYTTVSEVLRNISANNQGTLSQSFSGAFAAGASGVALRGLTVGATLVLIDGHRSAPYPLSDDGQRSFVDISAIPFDAIDRIEILKDGASAVYGSDAIAGVVNVILKKSFSGTRINVDAGVTGYGDGGTQHISITHGGGDLDADGHTGLFSVEYRHQAPISLLSRPGQLTLRDYTPYGGVNATPGVSNAVNGGYPYSTQGYTVSSSTGAVTSQVGSCQATNAFGPNCPISLGNMSQLQPDTHNLNLLGKYTQLLAHDWQLSLTGSVFSSAAEQQGGFPPNTGGFLGSYGITAGPSVSVPTAFPATGGVNVIVPSTTDLLFSAFTGIGPNHNVVDSQTYRAIAELTGEASGWNVDATAGFNKALLHSKVTGDIYIPGLQSLLATLPANATAAQTNALIQNPAYTGLISPLQSATSTSEVDYISLHVDRELFKIDGGGPVSLALGTEYTHHALSSLAPPNVAAGTATGNDAFAVGEQDIASAYVELEAQVLKSLEIDLAGRVDDVNTYGTSTTPKVGIKWTPIHEVSVRGTYARGFRAPNPAEAGNAGQAFYYAAAADPVLCPGGGTLGTDIKSQCNILPTFYQESNRNLQPEKSQSWTFGVVFEPISGYSAAVDYYHITLNNQITSAINAAPLSALVGNAVRGPAGQTLTTEAGNSVAIPVGLIEYIPTPYINANTLVTSGIDIDLSARFRLDEANLIKSNFNATHVFHYTLTSPLVGTVELAGTHGPTGISGDTGTPQTRVVFTNTWEHGPFDLTAVVNYTSHYGVTDPAIGETTCLTAIDFNGNGTFAGTGVPSANTCQVASFTTVDLTGRYKLEKNWTIHGTVLNALNRMAPLDLETYGGSNYNPSLAQAGVVGRFFEIGATYDF